jgi:hypothetical protein
MTLKIRRSLRDVNNALAESTRRGFTAVGCYDSLHCFGNTNNNAFIHLQVVIHRLKQTKSLTAVMYKSKLCHRLP